MHTENKESKLHYIMTAPIGTTVAFLDKSGRTRSAQITKRSSKNEQLVVETKFGKSFQIDYTDVVWVKTGSRWPKGVYKMLKGEIENGNKDIERFDEEV